VAGSRRLLAVASLALAVGTCMCTVAESAVGTRTFRLGATFTATGQSGRLPGAAHRAVGTVVVTGRWNGGAWQFVTRATTDAQGRYHFKVKPVRRGQLELRIRPPDNALQRYVLRVV
jgi:hypothetical protein